MIVHKPFHLYRHGYARAFIRPHGLIQRIVLLIRGWLPHDTGPCWQKPNRKQRKLDWSTW